MLEHPQQMPSLLFCVIRYDCSSACASATATTEFHAATFHVGNCNQVKRLCLLHLNIFHFQIVGPATEWQTSAKCGSVFLRLFALQFIRYFL